VQRLNRKLHETTAQHAISRFSVLRLISFPLFAMKINRKSIFSHAFSDPCPTVQSKLLVKFFSTHCSDLNGSTIYHLLSVEINWLAWSGRKHKRDKWSDRKKTKASNGSVEFLCWLKCFWQNFLSIVHATPAAIKLIHGAWRPAAFAEGEEKASEGKQTDVDV
jgi:hypothetical protein